MPGTIWRYTTRRVLVTEWVDGRSPTQLLADAEAPLVPPPAGSDPAAVAAQEQEARERRRQARRQVLSLVRMGVQCSLAQVRGDGQGQHDRAAESLVVRPAAAGAWQLGWLCKQSHGHTACTHHSHTPALLPCLARSLLPAAAGDGRDARRPTLRQPAAAQGALRLLLLPTGGWSGAGAAWLPWLSGWCSPWQSVQAVCNLAVAKVWRPTHSDLFRLVLLQADGRLCYLDFGLVVRVTPEHRQAMMVGSGAAHSLLPGMHACRCGGHHAHALAALPQHTSAQLCTPLVASTIAPNRFPFPRLPPLHRSLRWCTWAWGSGRSWWGTCRRWTCCGPAPTSEL